MNSRAAIQVIAHRGLSGRCPENTLPAFRAAIAAGPEMIETDFYSTSDGVLVCLHDRVLNRYLAGQRPELVNREIGTLPLSELQSLDLGSWKSAEYARTQVATLASALELLAATTKPPTFVIEHKTGSPEQLLTLLAPHAGKIPLIIQSFDWQFLAALRRLAPELPLAALGSGAVTAERIAQITAMGCIAAHWSDSVTTAEVAMFHAAKLQVWAYTLNTELSWHGAIAIGLDAVTTDWCDRAKAFLRAHQ